MKKYVKMNNYIKFKAKLFNRINEKLSLIDSDQTILNEHKGLIHVVYSSFVNDYMELEKDVLGEYLQD